MSSYPKPTWTKSGKTYRTTHAGYPCVVHEPSGHMHRWRWEVGTHSRGTLSGAVDSLELAKGCALGAAEARAQLSACLRGKPSRTAPQPSRAQV